MRLTNGDGITLTIYFYYLLPSFPFSMRENNVAKLKRLTAFARMAILETPRDSNATEKVTFGFEYDIYLRSIFFFSRMKRFPLSVE